MNAKRQGLGQTAVIVLVICALAGVFIIAFALQAVAEQGAFDFGQTSDLNTLKTENEIAKLSAEIRQIRSETSGSLFWLKVIAVFVTVGGAVGGYLVGQSRITKARLDFEDKKAIDAAYQGIVQELSASSPVSRAAAAVKLGQILKQFPVEWEIGGKQQEIEDRKQYLVQLTKQVLAAALAIEEDPKVLKVLTIALVLHHPWTGDPDKETARRSDARELDLSLAKATDAYWARVDFTGADFYKANLAKVSFRRSILHYAQFREADAQESVFIDADCQNASFKLSDLRGSNFQGAKLHQVDFEGAKVHNTSFADAEYSGRLDVKVDISPFADGSSLVDIENWLKGNGAAVNPMH
jgi:Pentapeptide repeats (9 copies)